MISPASKRVAKTWEASFQLAFDIAQLTGLLYFTGGVVNPFALLMIAPVTVGAATLPAREAVACRRPDGPRPPMFSCSSASRTMPWVNGVIPALARAI